MTTTIGGTTGITFPDATTQNTSPYTGGLAFRNRIINGAMMIDQRNAGASVSVAATTKSYAADRFYGFASQSSKFTVQQNAGSVTPPSGFTNYLGATSSSAYSVLSGDYFFIDQPIEGLNISDLGWGTAGAATVTLSFWVRSSLTGTFGGSLRNNAGDRAYPFSYVISAANTWEQKSITIAGDTTGTWLTTNGIGISLSFGLGVGSTYSGTAGSWSSANYISATGATSVVGTNGATFYITGVQLEKGSTATSFDYRPYGTELALCQRYYWLTDQIAAYVGFGAGLVQSSTQATIIIKYPVTMRATPTFGYNGTLFLNDVTDRTVTSVGSNNMGPTSGYLAVGASGGGLTVGRGCMLYKNNAATDYLYASAEL